MKILVIGAKGQLGQEFFCLSRSSDHDFRFADLMGDVCDIEPLDITDRSKVLQFVTPDTDVIINCAAYNEVDTAEDDDQMARKVNVEAVGYLAEAALKADALLIHFSTDYVFDGKSNVPYTEEDEAAPLSAYGRSKLAGEQAVIQSGCRYMIFRTSWLYSCTGKNFFKTMAQKCAECPSLMVVNDQIGTPTYAYNLAWNVMYIIDSDMLDKTGLYHYSDEGVASWYDFAKEINDLLGYTCDVMPCRTDEFPRKAKRPSYSVLDKKKIKETFGIVISHWRESLRLNVDYYCHFRL